MLGSTHLAMLRELGIESKKLQHRILMKDAVIAQQSKRITELQQQLDRANVLIAVNESLAHGR